MCCEDSSACVAPASLPISGVSKAIDLVESKCDSDGKWSLDVIYPGMMPVEIGEYEGQQKRWITLGALRVLDWFYTQD